MNTPSHWLSLYSAVMCLTIGLAQLFDVGPRFLPPSWRVIFDYVPYGQWLYPSAWVVAGAIAAIGIRSPAALRAGFRLCAILFLFWGLAGIPAWLLGLGGNVQGTAANFLTAGALWVLSYYVSVGVRGDKIIAKVALLSEQLGKEQGAVDA